MAGDPAPTLAVSTVIFGLRGASDGAADAPAGRSLHLPLVRRIREPYLGRWALPGGPLRASESLREAARRNLRETTGLDARHLEQLYTFGAVERSPGDRVVSIVYWALVREEQAARVSTDENTAWFPAEQLPPLAFDHEEIVGWAVRRVKNKIGYTRLAHALLPEEFTLAELREVYEAIWGRELDPANFRRSIESTGTVERTGRFRSGGKHRPPALYRSTAQTELLL